MDENEELLNQLMPGMPRRPCIRPYACWAFESGISRIRHHIGDRPVKCNVIYATRDVVHEDQRAWLAEHGFLQEGWLNRR